MNPTPTRTTFSCSLGSGALRARQLTPKRETPIRCGINDHPPHHSFHNNNNTTTTTTLRLCDPDWILGPSLPAVDARLQNFSHELFTTFTTTTVSTTQQDLPVVSTLSVEIAVATVRKMNLPSVLRSASYYVYEDEDDMINDAAQIFAHELHARWWPSSETGILLFLSVQDRVCFISTGGGSTTNLGTILPWWRLDHVVSGMKPLLADHDYGAAILQATDDLERLLQSGPPTMTDKVNDFMNRFGVVLAFAAFTFVFGAWGEYRDRRHKWQHALERSTLSEMERLKAKRLQEEYSIKDCPICLEALQNSSGNLSNLEATTTTTTPTRGADGQRLKILRCGHAFCDGCCKAWIQSGCGNPCNCPVCRQDVGKKPRYRLSLSHPSHNSSNATRRGLNSSSPNAGALAAREETPLLLGQETGESLNVDYSNGTNNV